MASSVVAETEEVGSTVRCSASAADAMNREARARRAATSRTSAVQSHGEALTWLARAEIRLLQLFVR